MVRLKISCCYTNTKYSMLSKLQHDNLIQFDNVYLLKVFGHYFSIVCTPRGRCNFKQIIGAQRKILLLIRFILIFQKQNLNWAQLCPMVIREGVGWGSNRSEFDHILCNSVRQRFFLFLGRHNLWSLRTLFCGLWIFFSNMLIWQKLTMDRFPTALLALSY